MPAALGASLPPSQMTVPPFAALATSWDRRLSILALSHPQSAALMSMQAAGMVGDC
jgi:hypothetical protein